MLSMKDYVRLASLEIKEVNMTLQEAAAKETFLPLTSTVSIATIAPTSSPKRAKEFS